MASLGTKNITLFTLFQRYHNVKRWTQAGNISRLYSRGREAFSWEVETLTGYVIFD
jgi:hypothetical protein